MYKCTYVCVWGSQIGLYDYERLTVILKSAATLGVDTPLLPQEVRPIVFNIFLYVTCHSMLKLNTIRNNTLK